MTKARRRRAGRPREVARPYRLHLYVEAAFAAEVKQLAKHLSRERGGPVSYSQAVVAAVRESPAYRAMRRKKE